MFILVPGIILARTNIMIKKNSVVVTGPGQDHGTKSSSVLEEK